MGGECERKLHVYTGNGKGKTTAAMGLALRALGHDKKVLVAQFLKDGTSGELDVMRRLGADVRVLAPVTGFFTEMTEEEQVRTKNAQKEQAVRLIRVIQEEHPWLIVLDELAEATALGALPAETAAALLDAALACGECVVTGYDAPAWLKERADYLTVMNAEKHPWQSEGLAARPGIEW